MKLIRLDLDEKYLDRISVSEIFHEEDIVGVNSLELRTPATVEEGQRLLFKDQLGNWQEFIIQDFDEIHEGSLTRLVYAEHSISELWTDYLVDKRPNGTASNALRVALEPTRWAVGIVNDFGLSSASFYNISVFEALSIIAKKWNCEIQPRIQVTGNKVTGRYIDLIIRGRSLGERFRYGKDMDFVRRTVSRRNLVTALYGYGKGEELDTGGFGRRVNFAAINGGKAYLENNTARLIHGRNNDDGTKSHLFGKVIFDEEEDPAVVKSLTQAELDKRSVVEVTYEFNVKDLTNRGREFERISVGDTIHARDDELNLDILARVTSIRRNLLYDTDREVTLGSYRTLADSLILDRNALDRLKGKEGVWDKVAEQIESGDGSYLTNLIDLLNEKMNLQGGYVYISDTGDGWITYDKPIDENPTSAIQIVGGGFRIANNKLPNGDWNWRTFGTGDGFVGDELVAGILRGGKVQWNLEDGTFLIGNSIDDYNLYFDGTNLFIKGDNIDLSLNQQFRTKVSREEVYTEIEDYVEENRESLKGEDGKSSYTWIRWADTPTSGMSSVPAGKKYIGIASNKDNPTPSAVYADYIWSEYVGKDGADGNDGNSNFTWIKYADDDKGTGMSDSPEGKRWLGVAENRDTLIESNDYRDYKWSPLYDNSVIMSATAPANPNIAQLWLDTSVTPNLLKRWTGEKWETISDTAEIERLIGTKVDKGDLDEQLSNIVDSINSTIESQVQQTNDEFNIRFTDIVEAVDAAGERIDELSDEIETNIRFTADGMEMGKSTNPISMKLMPDRLGFWENGIEIAYFSNDTLFVNNLHAKESVRIGSVAWVLTKDANGNVTHISLRKVT